VLRVHAFTHPVPVGMPAICIAAESGPRPCHCPDSRFGVKPWMSAEEFNWKSANSLSVIKIYNDCKTFNLLYKTWIKCTLKRSSAMHWFSSQFHFFITVCNYCSFIMPKQHKYTQITSTEVHTKLIKLVKAHKNVCRMLDTDTYFTATDCWINKMSPHLFFYLTWARWQTLNRILWHYLSCALIQSGDGPYHTIITGLNLLHKKRIFLWSIT